MRMLSSLPRSRSVAAISYGCIGRSASSASTAKPRGFPILRFFIDALPSTVYPTQDILKRITRLPQGVAAESHLCSTRLERLDIDRVTVRGRRAIVVMVVAATALVLSGSAFLHTGAKSNLLAPASPRSAPSRPAVLPVPDAESAASRLQPVTLTEAEA